MKQISLRSIGLLGTILFVPLFFLTFADPQLIENSGKSFIEWKLNTEANKKIDNIQIPQTNRFNKLLGEKAKKLLSQNESQLENLKQRLKDDVPAIMAEQISKMRNLDCDCRKKWENTIRNSIIFQITSLEKAKEKLINFGQMKYMEIVKKLTQDVRIFLGTNAIVFIFLLLLSFFKPQAINHLFLPGILLLSSTLICSYFYIFEQNWFYTIIYNDYTGFGFLVYLLLVFGVLCDIAFNKAKVTTEIINSILNAIGSAFNLAPC